MKRILVWDIPTRLFHWLFAISFGAAWLTSDSDQWLSIHAFFGFLMLGLVAFRLIWGFVGGHYARFAAFCYSPRAGYAYLRQTLSGRAARHLGHNPAGSQAVYLLLALAVAVGLSGIFALGGEEAQGPAAGLLSLPLGRKIKEAHEVLAILMLLVVIGHLAGVAIESWLHKENLPKSMLTGLKESQAPAIASRPNGSMGIIMLLAATVFGTWWFAYTLPLSLTNQLGIAPAGSRVAFIGAKLPDDPLWREECGSCHLAFHPNLLPARSWEKLMAGQAQHFDNDLGLDAPTSQALLAFLTRSAAENSRTEAAFKINRSIPPAATPLQITETGYWTKKHREISAADWQSPKVKSKANCAACHLDAEAGTFEDAAMRLPG